MFIKNKSIKNQATYVTLLFSVLFLLFFCFIPSVYADYADGTGKGQFQNQVYWLDWQGFTFANGHSKTFDLPGGVVVTATVSNVSGGTISVAQPEDYQPAAMNRAYPHTGYRCLS